VTLRQQQTETTVMSLPFLQPKQKGLTLIESLATLAVTAVITTAALPCFSRWIDQQRLNSAAQQLLADLQLVRTEAVARQQGLRFTVLPLPSGSCYVLHTGSAGACDCTTSSSGPAECRSGAREVKTVRWSSPERLSLSASASSLLFDPVDGTSTPTATLEVSNHRGQTLRHVVNVMGRTRTCSPGSSWLGYPVC
jgi:type IV fimbrial biogenesis protein FimT